MAAHDFAFIQNRDWVIFNGTGSDKGAQQQSQRSRRRVILPSYDYDRGCVLNRQSGNHVHDA